MADVGEGGGQLRPGQAGGLRWADPGQAADPDQLIRDAVHPDERLSTPGDTVSRGDRLHALAVNTSG